MIHSTAHPGHVGSRIIHPIGIDFAPHLVHAIIHPYLLSITLRAPFLPTLFDIPAALLFLGIYGYDWLSPALTSLHPVVNILELSGPIRMSGAFLGFLITLQAITQVIEQSGHGRVADAIALRGQGSGQLTRTPTRPAERAFRITPRCWFHQCFQRQQQARLLLRPFFATATPFANALRMTETKRERVFASCASFPMQGHSR